MKNRKNKKIICIVAAMALMLMGASSAITASADGYEEEPCRYCGDGLIWRSEEPYKVLVGTKICSHGYTKGTDAHYENHVKISRECSDCEMLRVYYTEYRSDYWICEGYNGEFPGN